MKNSARRVDLKNKTIVIMYMLYFGDMVSITPFLEVLKIIYTPLFGNSQEKTFFKNS